MIEERFASFRDRWLRIDCGDAGVAEPLTDRDDVDARSQQVYGHAMPHAVRVEWGNALAIMCAFVLARTLRSVRGYGHWRITADGRTEEWPEVSSGQTLAFRSFVKEIPNLAVPEDLPF